MTGHAPVAALVARQRKGKAMSQPMESRTLWRSQDEVVTVEAAMFADTDASPDDADCYTTADITAWKEDQWRYVGMEVTVTVNSMPIGQNALWGIEHGTLSEGTEADAWTITPAEYPEPNTVVMSSPLTSVILDALETTAHWLNTVGANDKVRAAVTTAQRWADPNNPDYQS